MLVRYAELRVDGERGASEDQDRYRPKQEARAKGRGDQ